MDQKQIAREMIARRAGRTLLVGLGDMVREVPSDAGVALRVTVTVIDSGEQIGTVDVDTTNADDIGYIATRRAAGLRNRPAPTGKPALRLVGGA
ncbi:hypothetical protein [Streptomyces violaceus]|uniref:Oxidoreductase n=1 Tax=Streptomyces violaceus TaxID=1936 RepID=A0ABY9UML9_STRVL|nr:hypothetical protein [Streptomyces janthinus]WND24085.1 hypothetical protein RI060_42970 [Streptomyces janthinus]GGS96304.1 hypothetical protein GCM10010270_80330 [Streptomyces janthinus]